MMITQANQVGSGYPTNYLTLWHPFFWKGLGIGTKTPDRFLKPVRCNEVENKIDRFTETSSAQAAVTI